LKCVQSECNLGEGGIFVTTTNAYWFIEDELQIFEFDCHLCGVVVVVGGGGREKVNQWR
jgi:hypothetical protein